MGNFDGWAYFYIAGIRLLLSCNHPEKSGFSGSIRTDNADNSARRHLETQVIDQQAIAICFRYVPELDDFVTQPFSHRNEHLLRLVAFLVLLRIEFIEARDTRLGFRLASLGVLAYPFQLFFQRLLACGFG